MRSWSILRVASLSATVAWFVAAPAQAIVYNESTAGDLSSDGNAPTFFFNLPVGTHSIIGSDPNFDRDFLTINVAAGRQLSGLVLVSYASVDGSAFIGMKNGTTIPTSTVPSGLDGYALFGTTPGNVGQDILDDIGMGEGSTGFIPPLPAGNYSFGIHQEGFDDTDYQFNFIISAMPPPTGLPGDYNDDDTSDAADYVVWRKNEGTTNVLPNDPDGGTIDSDQYDTRRETSETRCPAPAPR